MTRFVDRGALIAGWIGVGMAVTVAVSFLLVIPIEPVIWLLALPSGVLIGYYADSRADRAAGPWSLIIANALWAGLLTGLTYALLILAVKGLFFTADDGYRDESAGGRVPCTQGADCVYQRYLADGRGDELAAQGVTDVDSFSSFYWSQQFQTAGLVLALTVVGGLAGGLLYGVVRPKGAAPAVAPG